MVIAALAASKGPPKIRKRSPRGAWMPSAVRVALGGQSPSQTESSVGKACRLILQVRPGTSSSRCVASCSLSGHFLMPAQGAANRAHELPKRRPRAPQLGPRASKFAPSASKLAPRAYKLAPRASKSARSALKLAPRASKLALSASKLAGQDETGLEAEGRLTGRRP